MTKDVSEIVETLQHRVNTLEYMLAQTMAISLRQSPNPEELLNDIQVKYAEKMASLGIDAKSDNKGFDAAERIITSVKVSM